MNDKYKTTKEKIIKEFEKHTLDSISEQDKKELSEGTKQLIKDETIKDLDAFLDAKLKNIHKIIKKQQAIKTKLDKKNKWEKDTFQRFNIYFRIQHIMLFTSVIILIITGLPIKFPNSKISKFMMSLMGGISTQGILHRIGAVLLISFYVFHTLYTIFNKEGRRDFLQLLPRFKDIKDVFQMIKYFFGFAKEKPKFDRFSYIEKFDYWAVYWGGIVMVGSGLIMWFHNIALSYFPKYVYDIAREAHSDEALLATLTIVIWHFYNVHFNPSRFPGSLVWWHGKLTKEQMIDEHPLEYERIVKEKEGKND
jgi:cytochrome b subunit of formate dehydrogenase